MVAIQNFHCIPMEFFLWNRYCKILYLVIANGIGASHVWRKMVSIREEFEQYIWWQVKLEKVSFWFDNWTKLGVLYHIELVNTFEEEIEVKDFVINESWDKNKLKSYLIAEDIIWYICEEIKPPQ